MGSGSLITFPLLLAVGYPPVTANVSNTIGLVPGGISGAIGYRRELAVQRSRIAVLLGASLIGGATGAALLLVLPEAAFDAIVPAFILVAVILVIVQPRLARYLAERGRKGFHPRLSQAGVFGSGIYGGYFGAAQGVLLLAVLGVTAPDDIQRTNGLKNLLAGSVNFVAGLIFVIAAPVAWPPAALLAGGSIVGGQVGAKTARRLRPEALRGVIVIVGTVAFVRLAFW